MGGGRGVRRAAEIQTKRLDDRGTPTGQATFSGVPGNLLSAGEFAAN
jgi:hypothetical protein